MWDITELDRPVIGVEKLKVDRVGIPHLAKNERDMGHPGFLDQDKA
jgi:hypothetical protein